MSDDRRDDGTPPDHGTETTHLDSASGSSGHDFASLFKALTAIEETMVRSSTKLSALLSSIASIPSPWLTDANRFGTLSGETFAHLNNTPADAAGTGTGTGVKTWVALDPEAPAGLGRIMMSWPAHSESAAAMAPDGTVIQTSLPGLVTHDSPVITGNLAIASGRAANDNVIWIGDDHIDGSGGVYGREPSVATLSDGKTVIAWIGEDNIVHAKLYPGEAESMSHNGHSQTSTAELNALLANLGEAAPALGADAGRLKVTALERGGFAAVWVAEVGLTAALIGKAFLTPAATGAVEDPGSSAPSSGWTIHDLPAVAVTGDAAGHINIAVRDGNGLELSYTSSDAAANTWQVQVNKVTIDVKDTGTESMTGNAATDRLEHAEDQGLRAHTMAPALVMVPESRDTGEINDIITPKKTGEGDAGQNNGSRSGSNDGDHNGLVSTPGTPVVVGAPELLVGGLDDGQAQTNPAVATSDNGNIHILSEHRDPQTGTSTLTVTTVNTAGHHVAEHVVTTDAITVDSSHPTLSLKADIAAVGSGGVGVAWVQNGTTADGQTVKEIAVQVYGDDGAAVSHTPVIVTVGDNSHSTVSGISIAGIDTGHHANQHETLATTAAPATDGGATQPAAEPTGPTAELAIVWVKDGNAAGFGAINAQVFAVDTSHADDGASGSHGLVALGRDCGAGGDDDKPFQLTDGNTLVVGRAPQAEGLHDGSLAVTWVAPPASEGGPSVIRGVVLDTSNGVQLQDLDLSGLMPDGVADGTSPTLTSDDAGDIIVAWLQVSHSGGYDHDAAVYRRGDHGQWTPPATKIFLAHFSNVPQGASITVTSGENPSLIVTWSDANNDVTGARFDLSGTAIGNQFDVHHDNNSGQGSGSSSNGSADNSGGVSTAALPDGQFIVVFTQAGGGGSDIGAQVFSTAPTADSHDGSGLDSSPIIAAAITAIAATVESQDTSGLTLNVATADLAPIVAPDGNSNSSSDSSGHVGGDAGVNSGSSGSSGSNLGQSDQSANSSVVDNSGLGSSSSGPTTDAAAAPAMFTVHVDFASDQIQLLPVGDSPSDSSAALAALFSSNGPTAQDLAITIETLTMPASNSGSSGSSSQNGTCGGDAGGNSGHGGDGNTDTVTLIMGSSDGSGVGNGHDDGSGLGGGSSSANDNFYFAKGYGGDAVVPEIHEDAPAQDGNTIAEAFDALQFANALSATGNDDVIMFDTSNVVTIRSFNTMGHVDTALG